MGGKAKLNLRAATAKTAEAQPWPLLVVDDDPQVHVMTRVLLRDFRFQERGFEVVSAHSAAEAREILAGRPDIPAMLLDVVMETDDAGLALAHHIRQVMGNRNLRIILRTGQPGEAPEHEVMLRYDINDYRAKTELTAQKLFTAIVGALRSHQQLDTIERMAQTLEERVERRTRELAQARAFAESLIEMLPNPAWFKDRDGRYRLYNRAFRDFFAIGETCWHGLTSDQAPGMAVEDDSDTRLLAGEVARVEFETVLTDCQGIPRNVTVAKAAFHPQGEDSAAGTIGLISDITEHKALERELRRLATIDPLTGAANRRHFLAAATQELDRSQRYGRPLTLVMMDIDHFKSINDSWGHGLGDEVLRRVVDACRETLRDADLLGRMGGEEFAILLPETGIEAGLAAAERLRQAVARLVIPIGAGDLRPTASFGVAERQAAETSPDHLLGRADRALYAAKRGGRDRVVVADSALTASQG